LTLATQPEPPNRAGWRQSGVNTGDVIDGVYSVAIKTPMDLAVELSGLSAGSKVTIKHITRSYWHNIAITSTTIGSHFGQA